MTHAEFNTFMRLVERKAELAVREHAGLDSAYLEEEIDELTSVLRAHIVDEED